MEKLIKRLLVFFIGLPALLLILFALPQFNHLGFSIVVIIVSIIGAVEFAGLLKLKDMHITAIEAALLGGIGPIFAALVVNFELMSPVFLITALCIGACWVLISRVFDSNEKLDSYLSHTAAGLAVLIYPGLMMAWIIALSAFDHAEFIILNFLLITFMNDAAAWAFGMLFGKNNRNIIAASPNKSIAGFIGGIVFSVVFGILAVYFFPDAFTSTCLPGFAAGAILGFFGGAATILGDLAESCLKRSAGVKDSGNIMPGRGGVLDCIDSLAVAAPIYYLIFRLLFT